MGASETKNKPSDEGSDTTGRCQGQMRKTSQPCLGVIEPQFAGRYVNIQLAPHMCLNTECKFFGAPLNYRGERQTWEDFKDLIQVSIN